MRGYILALLFLRLPASAMIFGNDDRLERYEIPTALALTYSKSTAALVLKKNLLQNHDRTFSINWKAPGVGRARNEGACKAAFLGQAELVSYCSSTLIAPDLLLTSGHCFYRGSAQTPEQVCASSVALFDFGVDRVGKNPEIFSQEQVFQCKKLELYAHDGDSDYAVVRLDRKVSGRQSFEVFPSEQTQPLRPDRDYWTSGYPRGSPNKTVMNARYFDFWGSSPLAALFQMESESGSSGSSVLDPASGKIIGLVTSSDCPDLDWSEEKRCFSEAIFTHQCRGVRVVLTDPLAARIEIFAPRHL